MFFPRYYYLKDKVKEYGMAGTCSMRGESRMLKEFSRRDEGIKQLGRPRHGRMNGLAEMVKLLTDIQDVLVSNPAGTLHILTVVFLSHFRKTPGEFFKMGHYRFIPRHFHFSTVQSALTGHCVF